MPRMARFIFASRQVVGLASWPKMATSPILPPCASMNSSLCTNMPPEPQHGSYTRPLYGSSISTSSWTTERGV